MANRLCPCVPQVVLVVWVQGLVWGLMSAFAADVLIPASFPVSQSPSQYPSLLPSIPVLSLPPGTEWALPLSHPCVASEWFHTYLHPPLKWLGFSGSRLCSRPGKWSPSICMLVITTVIKITIFTLATRHCAQCFYGHYFH